MNEIKLILNSGNTIECLDLGQRSKVHGSKQIFEVESIQLLISLIEAFLIIMQLHYRYRIHCGTLNICLIRIPEGEFPRHIRNLT